MQAFADQANPPPTTHTIGGCTIHLGDCRHVLRSLPAQSVNCCVTSPPYFGLRDYGHSEQIGLETSPAGFVDELVLVFRELRRVLKDNGTVWLNLGDSYAGGGRGGNPPSSPHQKQKTNAGSISVQHKKLAVPNGLKPKDLIGIPWRVAFALQEDGWYLRQDIIWHKPNPMPESVRDRCTKAHEYMFLLSKSDRYYFDHEAMQEPAVRGPAGSHFHTGKTAQHQLGRASSKPRTAGNKSHKYVSAYDASETQEHRTKAGLMKVAETPRETRNCRSVWTIATKPFRGAHFATFPPDLIKPCILAGCPEGGTVIDPFFGAGTTGLVANAHGRKSIGIELNAEYFQLATARLRGEKIEAQPEGHSLPVARQEPAQPTLF